MARPKVALRSGMEPFLVPQRHEVADDQLGKLRPLPLLGTRLREKSVNENTELPVALKPRSPVFDVQMARPPSKPVVHRRGEVWER